jgi:hypothetical protein
MAATIPAADTANIENANVSKGVRRVIFGFDLHSWEQLMLLSLGLAGLIAITVFVTTASVVILQRRENAQLREALTKANVEITNTQADIAQAQREAAEARLEQERLKSIVVWRNFTPAKMRELVDLLRATSSEPAYKVLITYAANDPEAQFFAMDIHNALTLAFWKVWPPIPRTFQFQYFELRVPPPENEAVRALRAALSTAGIPFSAEQIHGGNMMQFGVPLENGQPVVMDAEIFVGSRRPLVRR